MGNRNERILSYVQAHATVSTLTAQGKINFGQIPNAFDSLILGHGEVAESYWYYDGTPENIFTVLTDLQCRMQTIIWTKEHIPLEDMLPAGHFFATGHAILNQMA